MMTDSPTRRGFGRRVLGALAVLLMLVVAGWFGWVYWQIAEVAGEEQARPADAIAVFGAAEYSGRPSPVLHARLDHAVDLYRQQIAPLVITLGGSGDPNSGSTEGGVGRDYLLANGVPLDHIIAETTSIDTGEQVDRLAEIAESHDLHRIVVVSDGTHLFRIRALCQDAELEVYTSPRAAFGRIGAYDLSQRYLHEMLSYTAFRLHLLADEARSLASGKA